MLNEKKLTELSELVKPVVEWLANNCDPHAIIVVDFERFDLYQAEAGGAIAYFKERRG